MTVMFQEMFQNLTAIIAIISPYGVGHTEYLGVLNPDVLCFQRFNESFKVPGEPGDYVDDILANSITASLSELLAQHNSCLKHKKQLSNVSANNSK